MGFIEWLRVLFLDEGVVEQERGAVASRDIPPVPTPAPVSSQEPRPLPAGRISRNNELPFIPKNGWVVKPPLDHEDFWRVHDLDTNHLDVISPKELLDMLLDLSPEVSRAAWDMQRLCNPGWEVRVYEPGTEDRASVRGVAHVSELFSRLRDLYGSVDIVLGRYFMGAFLSGGFCSELVLDAQARETVDLVSPDPYSIRFRQRMDPIRGEVWEPGQWQGTKFVSLEIPTFRYLPVDPVPASPYGRSLASPALFTSLFLLSLMHDVKRVIMQQGYKRMDISIDTEMARDAFEFDQQGYKTLGDYIRGAINAIKSTYAGLQPDDAFVHTDIFSLNTPVGTVDTDSIGAIDAIIERLEKSATRALKSNGLIMGTENSTSETDSNRRWEIHAAGIKSLQHLCENMLESLLTVSLRAKGIQARVRFRFSELRAAEMLRDEQTRQLRITNARAEYDAGFVSQDEAANNAVGHNADAPEPRFLAYGTMPADGTPTVQDNSDGNENLPMNTDDRAPVVFSKSYARVSANGNGVH